MPTISTLSVNVETNTSKFARGMRTATLGLGALAAGAAFAFKEFEESEKIMSQSAAVIKSTGGAANVTSEQVTKLAGALSAKAGIDDELIQSGENVLLTFKNIANEAGRGNDIFNQATTATLDLSVAMGTDMKSAAVQVGKALNDPIAGISALTRVGVTFTEQQKEQIAKLVENGNALQAQKIILRELTTEFGGSAEAQATASGKMSVAFGNLAEAVGAVLAPAIEKLVGWVTTAAEWFTNLDAGTQTFITTAGGATVAVGILAKAFGSLLLPGIRLVMAALTTLAAHPIVAAMIAFGLIVAVVATKWDELHGAVKVVLTVLSPFGVLIGLLIRNFDNLKDGIGDVANFLKGPFVAAWNAVKGPVLAVINGIIAAVRTLIGWIQSAVEWLGRLLDGLGSELADKAIDAGVFDDIRIPGAASGGFVARSGMAVIHKGEMITPAGEGGLTVNVYGWVGSDTALTNKIHDMLLRKQRSNVTLGFK